ncbi:hypothetical protein F7725_008987 [Dissostichus mawsoni]|uniref:Glucokinase regulator n=1 Tax=Dissostichus mawsoni TaxID=36200 RepID=A0A7J5Z9W0_DISMA|nr:hypothetical protein F7725_008987 [Dissostichus mawsoni]
MLQACDSQMFLEEAGPTRLMSDEVVETLMEVAKKVELILKDPQDSLVVLSGCGTSGRLAFLVTSAFNRALKELNQSPVYSYIIAGGDKALFSSQEAPEDDPKLGMLSLKESAGSLPAEPSVYTPVLVGFNPTQQARDEPIPGCSFTFRSVVQRMEELAKSQKAFLLNPAVGPEAISGSSRMKGGSATKILLEVRGRRVCYLGWGSLGVLGLIDASECVPTFGAGERSLTSSLSPTPSFAAQCTLFRRLRRCSGFISGGYNELKNNEGPLGPDFRISHEDFLHLVLPSLDDQDMVLLIYTQTDDVGDVEKLARRWELCTKLFLNALSTGAHVLKGKIYQNHMMDLQVTNSKLYCRATRLLQKLSGRPESKCEEALLKAVYKVDNLTVEITSSDISTHTHTARTRTKVVPLALVCLLTGCSLAEAELRLEQQPIFFEQLHLIEQGFTGVIGHPVRCLWVFGISLDLESGSSSDPYRHLPFWGAGLRLHRGLSELMEKGNISLLHFLVFLLRLYLFDSISIFCVIFHLLALRGRTRKQFIISEIVSSKTIIAWISSLVSCSSSSSCTTSKFLPSSTATSLSPSSSSTTGTTARPGDGLFFSWSILRRSNSLDIGSSADGIGFSLRGLAAIFLRTHSSHGQYSSSLRWSLNSPVISPSL